MPAALRELVAVFRSRTDGVRPAVDVREELTGQLMTLVNKVAGPALDRFRLAVSVRTRPAFPFSQHSRDEDQDRRRKQQNQSLRENRATPCQAPN